MAEWAPYLLAGGSSLAQWASANARSVSAFYISLPTDCRGSIIHVASVCMGSGPLYFPTPGFAPFSLSWGWLLIGWLIGTMIGMYVTRMIGPTLQQPQPLVAEATAAIATAAAAAILPPAHSQWQSLLEVALASAVNSDQQRMLRHLLQGGETTIDRLAASSHLATPEFIYRVTQHKPAQVVPSSK